MSAIEGDGSFFAPTVLDVPDGTYQVRFLPPVDSGLAPTWYGNGIRTASTTIREATSPPGRPPMPSATMNSPSSGKVAKLSSFGTFPGSYQLGFGVFTVHPEIGPSWKIRAAIVLLLPRAKR